MSGIVSVSARHQVPVVWLRFSDLKLGLQLAAAT
jgi:hypothetical protein